jgi:hypothetical protein
MFSFTDVMHFLAHELTGLRRGCFSLSVVLPSAFQCQAWSSSISIVSVRERKRGARPTHRLCDWSNVCTSMFMR